MDQTRPNLNTIEIEKCDISQELSALSFDEAGNATRREILKRESDTLNDAIEVSRLENLQLRRETGAEIDDNLSLRPPTLSSQSTSRTADEINIDQPLALFESVQRLTECVTRFATRHGLRHKLAVLIRSAEVERDKYSAIGQPGFPEHEIIALTDEADVSFWHQSRDLRAACLVIGVLSAACQGWQQSVIGGSGESPAAFDDSPTLTQITALAIAEEFGLHVNKGDSLRNNHDLWIFGLLTAIVSLSSGILSVTYPFTMIFRTLAH